MSTAMHERDPSLGDLLGPDGAHGSPLFDFLTAFAPRKLKDLFRLCEYLYFNSAQIYAALQKFCTLPITDIVYNTTNESLKKRYETLHNKQLKTKRILHRAAIDKFVYGNALLSLYSPFIRFLRCPRCEHLTNIATVDYKFTLKKLQFTYACSSCRAKVDGRVVDRKITRTDRISIIRWDPKLIDIDHNPITGHSQYYYAIPRELKDRVSRGNPHLINTMPMEFLKALRDDKIFKFAEGQIFHMKMDAPAGIEAHWGFPPLASAIKLFFYAAVLRKANAAIAQDYVVPLRIVSPKQSSANADPVMTISLDRWASEMKTNVKRWRRDPLHIMWSPVPAEVTHLGGQARALMTLGEVQDAEENIIAALGLPKEFIQGGFSAMGSGIQLRVLENQLLHQTGDLNDLLQWITDKVARLLGWAPIEAELAPFRLIDDAQQKMVLLEINRSDPQGPWISKKTIGEAFEIDPVEEREQRKQEALDEVRYQQELQAAVAKLQNNLATQVQSQAAMGQRGLAYDQQQVIAQADQMVQQLLQLDPGTRRSQLHGLEIEDLVMYSVVKKRLEDAQVANNQAAVQQARASGSMDGMGGGAAQPG
jgi:tetratricopeptide (TPR) repeat protein